MLKHTKIRYLGVSESDLIYHSLFIIAQVFQVILCVDALYQRNTGKQSNIKNHSYI